MEKLITQAKNFINNMHEELQTFIMTKQDEGDDFPNSWYAIDFDDVQNTIEWMNQNPDNVRPIVQVMELDSPVTNKTRDSQGDTVQKININLALYIVVTDKVQEGTKRKILLNELASELKYKFDNYYMNIPHFRRVSLSLPNGILNRDSAGMYSCRLDLYAEIYKKVR